MCLKFQKQSVAVLLVGERVTLRSLLRRVYACSGAFANPNDAMLVILGIISSAISFKSILSTNLRTV